MIDSSPVNPRQAAGKAAAAAAAIERAADAASDELAYLQSALGARDGELERLQEVADERSRVIDELTEHAETYRRAAEDRAGLLAALDFELQRMREEAERAVRERTDALAAAERAYAERTDALATAERLANELGEERQQARFTLQEREGELRAAHREAEQLRARVDVLESALAARSKLIDELQSACDERLAAVDRLSNEVNALRLVAEERALLLQTNEATYRAREARLAAQAEAQAQTPPDDDGIDWRGLAEERERALRELAVEAERRSVLLAEVTAALEGRTREVEDLRKRLTRAS